MDELTKDERAVIEAYRFAKVKGEILHVVCRGLFVKIYHFKQQEAQSVRVAFPTIANKAGSNLH